MAEEKTGLIAETPVIFELSGKGRRAVLPPRKTVPDAKTRLPDRHLRKKKIAFPELSQSQVVRHFTNLSRKNFSVDGCFYPLGSCTMKYNPKINEDMAALEGFTRLHPFLDESHAQGILQICFELEQAISKLTGMPGVSLQPAAGAHGELASMLMIRAYFDSRGEAGR
ncbi:aminomethyl-transferring glycine dehydrogenase subunit GcvPB, partial [Candidatus Sumerlaeota bacterium]|nr:aminomethyl-transferring glycine dehydrogenase subunit GcvPB [Candidatus Sumerlaeota bacterium]